ILGYHYYTELAHSAGMDKGPLASGVEPRERVRAILYHMAQFDNTIQYQWFIEIARAFFNYQGQRLSLGDASWLCDTAEKLMASADRAVRSFYPAWGQGLRHFFAARFCPRLRSRSTALGGAARPLSERSSGSAPLEPGRILDAGRALPDVSASF